MGKLSAKVYKPEKIEKVLLCVHGFASDKDGNTIDKLGKTLVKQNVLVIAFDLPCHGENKSTKVLSLDDCLHSLKFMFEYLKKAYKGVPVSIFATSFGAYLSLLYLSKNNQEIDKLILRAPAIRMDEIFARRILLDHKQTLKSLQENVVDVGDKNPLFVDYKFYQDLHDNKLDKCYKDKNTLYIIQGLKDDVVNFATNETFYEKHCKNNYKLFYLKNADHSFKNKGEIEKIVKITSDILK